MELEAVWDGAVILMTRRASLSDLARRFDITWFLGAIRKYRRLLLEVLAASFCLQLFGLISPPLLPGCDRQGARAPQHEHAWTCLRSASWQPALFEVILGVLRTYLFSRTPPTGSMSSSAPGCSVTCWRCRSATSRRDGWVISVARVRELENIRNFLTSSALTLVIDLFFSVVFIAVLFFYSPTLSWIVLASLPIYVAISAGATPLFQQRLDDKFQRGAENQAFLVETVTAMETLKAMAVEPQMQRRWGAAACRVCRGKLSRHQPRERIEPISPVHQQAGQRGHPLFRRTVRHDWRTLPLASWLPSI